MSDYGLKIYEHGLKKRTHDHNIPKNPSMPRDLLAELKKDKAVLKNFEKLAPSYKRVYFRNIERARLKETREKRIQEIIKQLKK